MAQSLGWAPSLRGCYCLFLQSLEQVGFHSSFPLNTGHTNNSLCQMNLV